MDIKDCPFCGTEASIYTTEEDYNIDPDCTYWIRCEDCDIEQHGFYTKEEAIMKWNKRNYL